MNRSSNNSRQYRTRTDRRSAPRSGSRQRTGQGTRQSARPKQSQSSQRPIRGKRTSVKAAARKQVKRKSAFNSKNLKRVKNPRRKTILRVIVTLGIVAVIAFVGAAAVVFQNDSSKYAASEKWRAVIESTCSTCGLDPKWTDCLLAAMVVESGADSNVESVEGVGGDIMQAAEGAYGWIVKEGWPDHGVVAETPEASIFAGVMEFKQNLELWEGYLGAFTPEDTTEIQLVIQGYNFGAQGWYDWCKNRGIRAYTVELAQEYSNMQMPVSAKGTPTHAQKWLNAYKIIHET